MAEQIPYGVASSLINTLASLASYYGFEGEIERLKKTLEGINAVLADADHKQQTDELIRLWIRDLKEVLYEADDLLDGIHAEHLLRQRDSKGKVKVLDFFSSSNHIAFGYKVVRKVRNIRERFNAVAETMSKLKLDARVVETKHEKSSNWRETSSEDRENIIGREESEKEVVDLLLNNNNKNENVSVVAIVGIGGLGKTALAQLVFNNAQVNNFFDERMWVCVSKEFDVKALVKKILESSFGNYVNDQPLELLQHKLRKNLNGERYLLVLDDVRNEDREKWFHLKKFLMCGAQGSKILVTTRSQQVANKMGVKTPYVLEGLKNDASRTLLKRLAFDQDQIMPQNLESICQQIAEKCAGVPLAIRVMGSLLQSKSQESEWRAILERDSWKFCEANNSIMPILRLSYDNLAIELKQCFVYCSLYPVDWLYEKDELITLWMAEGFLETKDEKECPEDVGKEYVRILLMKSFLQDVKMDEFGEIQCFKMHDLMHDLSQSVASSDHWLYGGGERDDASCAIRASFEEYDSDSSLNMSNPGRLRTFLDIKLKYSRDPSDLFMLKRLRSLDLSRYEMRDLPESIGKMIHLRYLNLSNCSELTCLPTSISNLINLQTLRLNMCHNLKFCGDIIAKLINLRRLDIEDCKAFADGMPIWLGRMTTLQNLSHFVVGNDDKEREKAELNEVKELSLRGSLVIENLHLVRDVEESSKDVNLSTKGRLISLTLKWEQDSEMENSAAMKLLENLRPHQNLKALTVQGYPGVRFSDWLSSCTNLVELKFSHFKNCKYLVALEGLVSLKTLHIENMHKLEYISYKGCSSSTDFFPSLEKLKIKRCGSLRGWLREANDQNTSDNEWHHSLPQFPRLSSLQIEGCPNLSFMPTFPNLVSLLDLMESSTKPLENTLNDVAPSLSKLKSLRIRSIDIEALPEEWMKKLSSLKHLSIAGFSSLEKPFRHVQNLSATLEQFEISLIDSWNGDEYYDIQGEDLLCLHSLQRIEFSHCDQLVALPEWICDLQSLRLIQIEHCEKLESFPERMHRLTNLQSLRLDGAPLLKERCRRETGADWPKVAHIPNIWID